MTKDEARIVVEMLEYLAEYYRRGRLNDKVIELYLRGLKDCSIETITHAIDVHINDPDQGQFFPKIADLRRHIGGTRSDRATLGWSKLMRAIRRVGAWQSVAFDDPIIHVIVEDLGGWPKVCDWTYDDLPFREQDFIRRYSACLRVSDLSYAPYMKGEIELKNGNSKHNKLLFIGDSERAQKIASGKCAKTIPGSQMLNRPGKDSSSGSIS